MKQLIHSGLPIWYDENNFKLSFRDHLTCGGDGGKNADKMTGLFYDEASLSETEHCYDFYRDIVFEKDRAVYEKYDYRYDITAIMPGTVNGECKKTSGHYHGYIAGTAATYPEVYEVLEGQAVFLLQKVMNFDQDEEPVFDSVKALKVEAGQAVIIPPFYGHCGINAGDGVLYFSNIAVVSCPLHYDPIKKKHGMGYYLLGKGADQRYEANRNYRNLPELEQISAKMCPELGITFEQPVYASFIEEPEKFDFLSHPEKYQEQMEALI